MKLYAIGDDGAAGRLREHVCRRTTAKHVDSRSHLHRRRRRLLMLMFTQLGTTTI